MNEGFNGIIAQLERKKTAIERALAALREIEGIEAPASSLSSSAPATRKGGMTPERRKRLSAALKKHWAAKKAAEGAALSQKTGAHRGTMTPEGRQRLAEAMKRRWAAKRAGSTVKKVPRKSRVAKKAA